VPDEEDQLDAKTEGRRGRGGGWIISGVPRRSGRPAEDHEAAAASTEGEGQRRRRGRVREGGDGMYRKKTKRTGMLCNGWQRWVISTQLHE
jgi:hypothetical protein